MVRTVLALVLSVVATAILLALAAMADGVCHCMNSMYTLFPYGTILTMRPSWERTSSLIIFIQFPLYALALVVTKPLRRKLVILIIIVVLHGAAAWLGLRDYCKTRRTCSMARAVSLS